MAGTIKTSINQGADSNLLKYGLFIAGHGIDQQPSAAVKLQCSRVLRDSLPKSNLKKHNSLKRSVFFSINLGRRAVSRQWIIDHVR